VLLVGLFHASFITTVAGGSEFIPGPAGTAFVIAPASSWLPLCLSWPPEAGWHTRRGVRYGPRQQLG
jgi:hypothetical protein